MLNKEDQPIEIKAEMKRNIYLRVNFKLLSLIFSLLLSACLITYIVSVDNSKNDNLYLEYRVRVLESDNINMRAIISGLTKRNTNK
ncbi:MAG: hypothetical protein KAH32_04445 [Chlamydiia bacterium]|nr:hypothetical protein [Chlamydiia bacterium]